jgi:hypothetical protein
VHHALEAGGADAVGEMGEVVTYDEALFGDEWSSASGAYAVAREASRHVADRDQLAVWSEAIG